MSRHGHQSENRSITPDPYSTSQHDISLSSSSTTSPVSPKSPRPQRKMSSGSTNTTVQSRRSHTKSRLGCKTCKKRHIRCDENAPQCKNCTKHNVRCDYMDTALAEGVPDLRITPHIQKELDNWARNGIYPFPSLGLDHTPSPSLYGPSDLRLVHHISSVAARMQTVESSCTYAIWTRRIPMFLRLAAHSDFVMHSLLGLSASHLGWMTGCTATHDLSYRHQSLALSGLKHAIGKFDRHNADAVLAASILLSWQVTDWRSWASLLQGTATVIDTMQSWRYQSEFSDLMDEKQYFHKIGSTPKISTEATDKAAVQHVYQSLKALQGFLAGSEEESMALEQLISFIHGLWEKIPVHSAEDQFSTLHPLRAWLFFLPIDLLRQDGKRNEIPSMVLLAHFFAVALAIEPLFPEIGAAYLGTMSVRPIEQIDRNLQDYYRNSGGTDQEVAQALQYMSFPRHMVHDFRQRMNHLSQAQLAVSSPTASHHSEAVHHHYSHNRSPHHSHPTAQQPINHHWQHHSSMVTAAGSPDGMGINYPYSSYDIERSQPASDLLAEGMWRR